MRRILFAVTVALLSGCAAPHAKLYPGTLIYISLNTEKFVPSEIDEEEFVWE